MTTLAGLALSFGRVRPRIAFGILAVSGLACSGMGCSGDGTGDGGTGSGGTLPASGGGPGTGGQSSGTGGGVGPGTGGQTVGTGAAAGSGGTSPSGGSGGQLGTCENEAPALAVTRLSTRLISELGRPFDPDLEDDSGPTSWEARYGKTPELVSVTAGDGLAVLYQDQDSGESAFVVHVSPADASYVVDAAFEVESLGRIMGLSVDEAGNYYVATGVSEDDVVDAIYPPNGIHREDIVRIVKFDASGCVTMESDVDIERGLAADGGEEAEIIVNPMVAATSRLAYGNGQLILVHGHNTEPDPALDGTRHQKAITTHLDAQSGAVTRASTIWASHSFDQRAFYDGVGFVELHLGDAYPRSIALGRYFGSASDGDHSLFAIKGEIGENRTFTRLGGIAMTSDAAFGYLALFSTERTTTVVGDEEVQGTRDLALVRVRADLAMASGAIVEEGGTTSTQAVTSGEESVTNSLHWLTDLGVDRHVERPRIVALSGAEFVLLWEEWTVSGGGDAYQGTFAMVVDAAGEPILGAAELPGDHHLSRGDDAVRLGTRAVYVTGSTEGLHLNLIAADLTTERITLH